MPLTLTCPECHSSLRVRDDLAGKKVKCPRCAHLILVPVREDDVTEVLNSPDDGIVEVKPTATKKPARRPRDEEDAEDEREERVSSARPKPAGRPKPTQGRRPDEKKKDRSGYKPCPNCGAFGAERVTWTPWGSFYGPAMCTHVRCPDCAYCYNGRTGRSNVIAIIIFITLPVLGILALLGFIAFIVVSRTGLG